MPGSEVALPPASSTETAPVSEGTPPNVLGSTAAWFRRRGPVTRGAFAFLLFAVASILDFALPVIGDLGHRCVGSCLADTHLYVWSFEWMRYATSHGLDPLSTTLVYAPFGINLGWVTTLPGPSLLMVPITSKFGALFSVNVLMIAAPALAGWATYLVCVRVTKRFWPSIAGGLIFAFSTYFGQHMRSHLNLVLIFFVPLAVYLVLRRVDRSMGRILFVILLAVVIAGQFSTSLELAATMAFFGGIAYLGALVVGPRDIRLRLLWTAPLVALSYALAGLMVSPILRAVLHQEPGGELRIPELNSVDLLSFIVPRAHARVGGSALVGISDNFRGTFWDDTGYVGVAMLAILVLFLIRFRRELWAWALAGFAVLIAALALGPRLHVDGQSSVWMPQALMAKLPFVQHALPERFPAYMFLVLGVITALWLAQSTGVRSSWWRYGLVAISLASMSMDLAWEPNYHTVDATVPFIAEGTYRSYLQPDDIVLVIPRDLGGELWWQADTGMGFKLARAYTGPVHPQGKAQAGLRNILSVPGKELPSEDSLRNFLIDRQVSAVVVQDPLQPELEALLNQILCSPPTAVGGVWIWDVPPDLGGVNRHC